ncbi:MAG: hypothetical protein VKS61_16850 [Candidatus Sericytochromatia bacterium]|nr:hypothetical protein [Candidatus Sericytochromatia bacterium]
MGHLSNQQDMYSAASQLAQRGATLSQQMTKLGPEAANANITQQRLTQLQLQLQDLQRQAEMIKEIQGTLKKNLETNNKAPQDASLSRS